jgi:predicted dienelactone hydrolase
VLLDRLISAPPFAGRVDQQRIGAVGFSLGGATVVSLAGGLFDGQVFKAFCASDRRDSTCDPQPEFPDVLEAFKAVRETPQVQASLARHKHSYKDPRVRAVFALAPALGGGFTDAGLKPVHVPTFIVVGSGDQTTPLATNAQRFAQGIAGAQLHILPNVSHYTLLSECTDAGKTRLPICRDPESVVRAATHRLVSGLALDHFDRSLVAP